MKELNGKLLGSEQPNGEMSLIHKSQIVDRCEHASDWAASLALIIPGDGKSFSPGHLDANIIAPLTVAITFATRA